MIALSWDSNFAPNSYDANDHIGALMKAYRNLPRHIAKKHLKAAMRRVLKPGVPILRRHTPPLGTRRGRRKAGEKAQSTGSLRRAVTTRAGQTGRNSDFDAFVYGVLGYRAGPESRKAIWLEFGTSRGGPRYDMVGKAMKEFGNPAANLLAQEMATGLEKAAKEIASGKNPGRN
jgi:hypothetical protein